MNTDHTDTSARRLRRFIRTSGHEPLRARRLSRALLLVAIVALAALGVSAAAGARTSIGPVGGGGDNDPPLPPPKPNLVIGSASVAAYGTSEWELRYTVTNRGNAGTSTFFHVTAQQSGSILLKDTLYTSLAAGASRSETIHVPRNNACYVSVRFSADPTHAVPESNEYDNDRWAVGVLSPTCATQPRYTVKAVSFHAYDETGIDWLGSDEPYWTFNSVGVDGTALSTKSRTFGDVDTGDTVNFGATEGCLYLACSGGPAPTGMGFSIQLWEHDLGSESQTLATIADYFKKAGGIVGDLPVPSWVAKAVTAIGDGLGYIASWAADDLIGSQTYAYDPTYLAQRLPAAGGSFTDTRTYSDGDGNYSMTVLVTRTF